MVFPDLDHFVLFGNGFMMGDNKAGKCVVIAFREVEAVFFIDAVKFSVLLAYLFWSC